MILSDDIDMKLNFTREPKQLEKTDVDVMSTSCDVHVIFPVYGQFRAIRKLGIGIGIGMLYFMLTKS